MQCAKRVAATLLGIVNGSIQLYVAVEESNKVV